MCVLKFMFEYGNDSSCIWSVNQKANDNFGYGSIEHELLGISDVLNLKMVALCIEFQSSLNWGNPSAPSPWTDEQREDFNKRAQQAYDDLVNELSEKYEVEYWV